MRSTAKLCEATPVSPYVTGSPSGSVAVIVATMVPGAMSSLTEKSAMGVKTGATLSVRLGFVVNSETTCTRWPVRKASS